MPPEAEEKGPEGLLVREAAVAFDTLLCCPRDGRGGLPPLGTKVCCIRTELLKLERRAGGRYRIQSFGPEHHP